MKIIFYTMLALLFINALTMRADDVDITPLTINYSEITQIDDNLYILGDVGCAIVSRDSGRSWKRIRPFKRGEILLLSKFGNELASVNSLGQIATADSKAENWEIKLDLDLRLTSAIQFPEGFFLRSDSSLIEISNDFQKVAETQFVIRNRIYQMWDTVNPRKSLAYINNKFIAETDTATFVRFNIDLTPIDTVSLKKRNYINDTSKYDSGYDLRTGGDVLYFSIKRIVNSNGKWNSYKSIYKTNDFNNIEHVADYPFNSLYALNKGEIYHSTVNASLIDSSFFSNENTIMDNRDIMPVGNKLIIAGRNGMLRTLSLKDSSLIVYSDASLLSSQSFPEAISDSTLMLYSGTNAPMEFPTSISSFDGIDEIPNTPKKNFSSEDRSDRYVFYFKYYDTTSKKLCLIGQDKNTNKAIVFFSDDFGSSYTKRYIENFSLNEFNEYISNAGERPNIHKFEDKFAAVMGDRGAKDIRGSIILFDSDFNYLKRITLSNLVIDYVIPIDTLSFIIHDVNPDENRSEFRFTSNGGKKWTTLKKYPTNFEKGTFEEFEVNHKKYFGFFHFDNKDSIIFFETLNLESREIDTIATWRVSLKSGKYYTPYVSMTYDDSFLYLAYADTLFAIDNLFNRGSWRKRVLPYKGSIQGFKKIGDRFLSIYNDKYIQDRPGFIWLKPEIPLSAGDEAQVERANYLFCFPPYPVPAKNEVRSLIYWDTSLDIDKDDISIYNLFGKVAGREDITIEKESVWSGTLVWNCSRYEPGAYFVVISHGDAHWMIKAIVER